MRFLVISDSHGRYERIAELIDMHKNIDALIFLGDGLADLERADAYSKGFAVFAVKGNCDVFSFFGRGESDEETVLNFEKFKIRANPFHSSDTICCYSEL